MSSRTVWILDTTNSGVSASCARSSRLSRVGIESRAGSDCSRLTGTNVSVSSSDQSCAVTLAQGAIALYLTDVSVPGVAQFTVRGGLRREMHVDLELSKLRALDLPVSEVVRIVTALSQAQAQAEVKRNHEKVLDFLKRHEIEPAERAGTYRLFDKKQLEQIRSLIVRRRAS